MIIKNIRLIKRNFDERKRDVWFVSFWWTVFCESQHTKKEGFLFKGKVFCGKLKTTVGVKKTFLPIFWWVKRITIHDFRKKFGVFCNFVFCYKKTISNFLPVSEIIFGVSVLFLNRFWKKREENISVLFWLNVFQITNNWRKIGNFDFK